MTLFDPGAGAPVVQPHPTARRTDPGTSHEAAASVKNPTLTQAQVLLVLRRLGSATDEEIAAEFPRAFPGCEASPSGLRSRRAELVKRGLVMFPGEYGETIAGRRTRKWRAV